MNNRYRLNRYFFKKKTEYIHQNPVRAGWVLLPQDYIYSSASNYLDHGRDILEVDILDKFHSFR